MAVCLSRLLLSVSIVSSLLILVTLLVLGSLGLVWGTLLVVQSLPSLTKNLADLTEADSRVFITDVLALLVSKEHVGGQTTLGRVRVLLLLLSSGLGSTLLGGFLRHSECSVVEVCLTFSQKNGCVGEGLLATNKRVSDRSSEAENNK